jgi:iron complex outermembrane receptor protein
LHSARNSRRMTSASPTGCHGDSRAAHSRTPISTTVSGLLRALSFCASATLVASPAAIAQIIEAPKLTIGIPAQPLGQALSAFATQTGLQLIYVSGVVDGQNSHEARAGLDAKDALTQLLQGTGLKFEFLTARSVRIITSSPAAQPTGIVDAAPPEIIVTATRREESVENVPITIQTINGEQLKELGITTFNDLLRYTPNVTFSGNGPATGNVFIRGLGAAGTGNQEQPTTGLFPNVAQYLDEQPMQFPSRNLDIYTVDLQRVEILEGPQGTLFGGGTQGGAVIYITNKPNLSHDTAELNAAYGITSGGAPNSALNATGNLALIPDTMAVRAVVYSETQGGYMSNVPSTISYPPGSLEATTGAQANNATLVGSDLNPVSYQGARVSLLWKLREDWNLLLQQNYQDMRSSGSFYAEPFDSNGTPLRPYQQADFAPSYSNDRFESTAWTANGRLGPLSAVYTGSFMIRHIDAQHDYSNYLRSTVGAYYGCIGPGAGYFNDQTFPNPPPKGLAGTKLTCYPPVGYWHDTIENQHQSHELRITTDPLSRLRAIAGAFWEKFVIFDQMDFNYSPIPKCDPANLLAAQAGGPACLSQVGPLPGSFANDPSLRNDVAFGNDDQRGYRQLAFFGSMDFDLIPKILTLTAGIRHYRYDYFESGSVFFTDDTTALILNHPNGACTRAGQCGLPLDLASSESGLVNRGNLTWHVTPDVMAYYTYSQGFRPAGFNRTYSTPGAPPLLYSVAPYCGTASTDPRCAVGGSLYQRNTNQYINPVSYQSDRLVNNEIGLKSEFLEHRVVANASAYWMNWNHIQTTLGDFANFGDISSDTNGPSSCLHACSKASLCKDPAPGTAPDRRTRRA